MLHPDNAEIVKATAPVVVEHITQITKSFYPKMFANQPQLRNLFNDANQAVGEQQVALASSIVAYARHLLGEDDFNFDAVVERIAGKHVSLGVAPGDYTIVGRNLLEAIADVLGEAVTPQVAQAWGEVYWLFAVDLISAEAKLYQQAGRVPSTITSPYRITAMEPAGADCLTFSLAPADGSAPPDYVPGQYVSLVETLNDGHRQPRQYTLSGAPGGRTLDITVRRVTGTGDTPAGAVSNRLFERRVGDEIPLSAPMGDIRVADGPRPLVMFSAGIGITPMAAIIAQGRSTGSQRRFVHVHADVDEARHPLREQVAADLAALPDAHGDVVYGYHRDGLGNQVDVAGMDLPPNAQYYLCGPVPFMQHVRSGLLERGVSMEDISYEIFGPDLWLAGTPSSQATPEDLDAV